MNQQAISQWIKQSARAVDVALYAYYFEDGSAEAVMDVLATYQNEDGGFGNAIEPDLRLPQSTALATWMAFQTIKELDIRTHPVIDRALTYLADTYSEERVGWEIVRPEVDDYPHAPWWNYKTAVEHFSWANPNAELLGLLMTYGAPEAFGHIIAPMKARAIEQVADVDVSDFHDVFNYKALYVLGDEELRSALQKPVEDLIQKAVTTDPAKWGAYVATPLKFIDSPEDEIVGLFEPELIAQNLDFIEQGIVDGTHWEPNWDWSGNYPEAWEKAKVEWSGYLTVRNLRLLSNFGRV